MDSAEYKDVIRSMRVSKKLGQNFLVNKKVAKAEANFGIGRRVIEMGPGLGVLTDELCKVAKHVLAVEKDTLLYNRLKEGARHKNLELLNADFFDVPRGKLSGFDIMIANIPYNMSSKTLMWLGIEAMPAVLCLQKEFVEHLSAEPDSRNYSKLSVIAALQFSVTRILDVPPEDFYPAPRVSSSIIYVRPKAKPLSGGDVTAIGLIMNHKKKKIRNAIIDSDKELGIGKGDVAKVADAAPHASERAFHLSPYQILETARYIKKHQNL